MSSNEQSTVRFTYATLYVPNPVFPGFPRYQNVNFGSQRDNLYTPEQRENNENTICSALCILFNPFKASYKLLTRCLHVAYTKQQKSTPVRYVPGSFLVLRFYQWHQSTAAFQSGCIQFQ